MSGVQVLQGALEQELPKGRVIVAKRDLATPPEEQPRFGLVAFLRETKEELDKVVWPGRQQLISESVAVLLMVVLLASLIYVVDNLFTWIAGQVFR